MQTVTNLVVPDSDERSNGKLSEVKRVGNRTEDRSDQRFCWTQMIDPQSRFTAARRYRYACCSDCYMGMIDDHSRVRDVDDYSQAIPGLCYADLLPGD